MPLLPEGVVKLFEYVLEPTYFLYQDVFYEHVEGVPPVVADFFMEAIEAKALGQAPLQPLLYRWFVDDTLLIWQHGREALDKFVMTFNGTVCKSIQFTKEQESGENCHSWTF